MGDLLFYGFLAIVGIAWLVDRICSPFISTAVLEAGTPEWEAARQERIAQRKAEELERQQALCQKEAERKAAGIKLNFLRKVEDSPLFAKQKHVREVKERRAHIKQVRANRQ